MPRQKKRPSVAKIRAAIRARPDLHWTDPSGRTYGFPKGPVYEAAEADLPEGRLVAWILLPPADPEDKEGLAFPEPGEILEMAPYSRPDAPPRGELLIVEYLDRPRRQRAAGAIVDLERRWEGPFGPVA